MLILHFREEVREGLKKKANNPYFVDKGRGGSSNVDKPWEGGGVIACG